MADDRKPRDEEIDVFGLTHVGLVRPTNEDHFLLGSLHQRLEVRSTSLPGDNPLRQGDERLAFLAMVADGVGGRAAGEEASRLALEQVTQYVAQSTRCYYQDDPRAETFIDLLQEAAMRSHAAVIERAQANAKLEGMATTLTLWVGVWPWIYLLQVGDSRYYLYRDGELTQVTRDQTMAEDLIDQGVMARSAAHRTRWANVLSSAIGGHQTEPVVTRLPANWGNTHLICSDGLTKHVSDEQIAARLSAMTSAQQACETLLADALADGGSDNITIIVGRAVRNDQP